MIYPHIYPHTYPHTLAPSHPYSSGKKASCLLRILWMGVRFNRQGAKKQLFIGSIAMVHCWRSYAAPLVPECFTLLALPRLLVFLCWTVGIAMLNLWYSYAEPLVPECYTLLVPFFQFVYRQYQGENQNEETKFGGRRESQ